MSTKINKYTVRYYKASYSVDGCEKSISTLLDDLILNGGFPVRALIDRSSDFQIRGLTKRAGENAYEGYFVRFRDDRPVSGNKSDHNEKPVALEDGYEIIEKNHFVIFSGTKYDILVFQTSIEGGSSSGLARYLSAISGSGNFISFNDIVTSASYDRLVNGGVIKHVVFKVAMPRSKRWQPDPNDTWTQDAMDWMRNTGATSFEAKVQTRSPKRGLFSNVRNPVKLLLDSSQTRKLKIKLSDIEEPIDLFADRVADKISVPMLNGICNSSDFYQEIWKSKLRNESNIIAYLGEQDEELDAA